MQAARVGAAKPSVKTLMSAVTDSDLSTENQPLLIVLDNINA